MQFLAHRGYWRTPPEKNNGAAFERAWKSGYGIETDVRDLLGTPVISHDPPDNTAMPLMDFLRARAAHGPETPLALNIKADGLAADVHRLAGPADAKHVFVFDMSVPDTLHYLRAGLPVFVRLSEYEPQTALLDRAAGVWLDAFESDWWGPDLLRTLAARGKRVAIVSPELHRRPHEALWRMLKETGMAAKDDLLLCTDFPQDAERFFGR
jgi:glycerophosphoryl diester phosphodiesterase